MHFISLASSCLIDGLKKEINISNTKIYIIIVNTNNSGQFRTCCHSYQKQDLWGSLPPTRRGRNATQSSEMSNAVPILLENIFNKNRFFCSSGSSQKTCTEALEKGNFRCHYYIAATSSILLRVNVLSSNVTNTAEHET